jgi:hypothetical protein
MMTEMRRLWFLLDTNDVRIRPRYIRSSVNIWANTHGVLEMPKTRFLCTRKNSVTCTPFLSSHGPLARANFRFFKLPKALAVTRLL